MADNGVERSSKVDNPFNMFMDNLAKAQKPNRNKIITEWLVFLGSDEQTKLINKLKKAGIEYDPKENTRYFESS
jgi:hypothetical protein